MKVPPENVGRWGRGSLGSGAVGFRFIGPRALGVALAE